MNSCDVQPHNWPCQIAVYKTDFQYWWRSPRVRNSGSKQMYKVCEGFNYRSIFMLPRTYMNNTGTHVCTKVPSVVLSALSTEVRAVSWKSDQSHCIWFLFWVLNPSYTALKVYTLLILPPARSLFLPTVKYSGVLVSLNGLFLPSPCQDWALTPMSSFFTWKLFLFQSQK